MHQKIAKLISILGNPLVLGLLYGLTYFYSNNNSGRSYQPLIFTALLTVPTLVYIAFKVKSKEFNDFDVSSQTKRNKLYNFITFLFILLSLFLFFYDYPKNVILLFFILLLNVVSSFLINKFIKASLHTSFNFLFSFLFYPISAIASISLFVFGFINMWSRITLKRHTFKEVLTGMVVGIIWGITYLYIFKFLQ